MRDRVFVDVGCAEPEKFSNTYYLEKHLGWSGLAVDANPQKPDLWEKLRPKTILKTYIVCEQDHDFGSFYKAGWLGSVMSERTVQGKLIKGKKIIVPTITLNRLLEDNKISKIDFLSMDIEGSELEALNGFDIARFKPQLVCIERNNEKKNQLVGFFHDKGYVLVDKYLSKDKFNWYFRPL